MTSKRKAEIQRKLSLASIPKPPDGLADRIKADIPKYLKATEAERRRHFSAVSLNMRVAASILLVVSALFVTMQLMSPEEVMRSVAAPPRPVVNPVPQFNDRIVAAPQEEVRVEIAQQAPAATGSTTTVAMAEAPAASADDAAVVSTAEAKEDQSLGFFNAVAKAHPATQVAEADEQSRKKSENEERGAGGVVGGVVGGVRDFVTDPAMPVNPPPVRMADAAAPAPVPPPAEPPAARLEASAAATPSPAFLREARASGLELGRRNAVFGITVDPEVFRRIKATLENGQRPSVDSVNIEALVNYFAGAPASAPKRDVTLEVEGSPVPVGVEGRRGILRFTIDTAPSAANAGSVPPIAKDAKIEIDVNSRAVMSFRPVFANGSMPAEAALLRGTSVTGLYEVELRSGITSRERVATIRLRYRSVTDGRERTITRELRGRDFANHWTSATRRHRLASLGAVWGETLKGTAGGPDVAKRAEELATQSPNDDRARDLAKLASTSVRLRGGAPTGSGR